MTHTELFQTYLHHYADKNLEAISAMLAEEVHLRDWNISVHGKAAALRETEKTLPKPKALKSACWRSTRTQIQLPGNFISWSMEESICM